MLTEADVIEALINTRPGWANRVITEAAVDSRTVIPGSLFVALPGERVDGHDYIQQAFEKGAHLAFIQSDLLDHFPCMDLRMGSVVTEPEKQEIPYCIRVDNSLESLQKVARFWRRKLNSRVIGITGSVGKSTTKEIAAEVLGQRFRTLKSPGNLNNEIGLPLTLLSLGEHHERVVLEMGFYVPGEIAFLCDIALPHVGVVTNIGTSHAERAGSKEAIAKGKAELVQALPSAPEGVAILNIDDPFVKKMAAQTKAEVFFYGMDPDADLWADRVEGLGLDGIRFRMHFHNEVLYLRIPLIGRHSVHSALRAAAIGIVEGLTWQEIVNGLQSERAQLRLVAVKTDSGALILDDTYNASPESMLAALNLLDELEGHKIAVLGDMLELGQYEQEGHEMVGVRVAEVVDELITVGERARIIGSAACRSGFPKELVISLADSQEAVELLCGYLNKDDVVLVKGSHGVRMDAIVSALEINQ